MRMCSGSLPWSTSAACTAAGGGGGVGLGVSGALDNDDGGLDGGRCGGGRAAAAAAAVEALGGFGEGKSFGGFGFGFGEGRSFAEGLEDDDCFEDGLLVSIDLYESCGGCWGEGGWRGPRGGDFKQG